MFKPEIREAFRKAALQGVPQTIGRLSDGLGGYCAVGLLQSLGLGGQLELLVDGCHLCKAKTQTYWVGSPIMDQWSLLTHLNNDHKLDWLGLAEKIPVTEE